MHLQHPYILAALPLAIALCAIVVRRSLVDARRSAKIVQLAIRTLFVASLLLALAAPIGDRFARGRSIVAIVDLSSSVDDAALDAAKKHLQGALASRGSQDQLALVVFGAHARRVEVGDRVQLPERSTIDAEATDLEGAVRLALGLFAPGKRPGLIVYTDGNETTGSVTSLLPELVAREIPVDVVPLSTTSHPEVLVRSLTLPHEVRPSARFDVSAEVVATVAQHAVATLYRDDFVNPIDGRKELDLPVGTTTVRWKSEVPAGGLARYSVRLSGPIVDTVAENNRVDSAVIAHGQPRVLLVEGGSGSRALAEALGQEHIDVEVRAPSGMPRDATQLDAYDLVALSDVAAPAIAPAQVDALETYIEAGGGFLFLGGENATDGWSGTRIEKLLPVRFDKERRKEEASLALELAIDRSGSMEGEGRLELAKEAAKATSELLGPDDLIGVIAFDAEARQIVRLQRAANRLRITTDIARLRAGGGTAILPALREAFTALDGARAKVKHVILLTDGQASYEGIPELVHEMVEHHITVSAVGVGGDADRSLLTTIARRGQGRFYFTRDAEQVPKIFLKETNEVTKRSLVEEPTHVRIVRAAELFAGTSVESSPPLAGYVSLRPKPGGEVLLVSSQGDPLLARRRDGLGQTAIWASDAKNRWAAAWLAWPGFGRFFAQLVRSTMRPPLAGAGTFPVEIEIDPPHARVHVDATSPDDRFVSGLDGYAELLDPGAPRGKAESRAPIVETAPGRYEAEVDLDRSAPKLVRVILRRDGIEVSRSLTAITPPAAREHQLSPTNVALLDAIATSTRGRRDPSPSSVFALAPPSHASPSPRPLWPPALWAALVLLVLDLAARRLPGSRLGKS